MDKKFQSFAEFYPYYLSEHADRTCRRMHFIGSSAGLLCLALAIVTLNPLWILAGLLTGYAMAWIGHFFFEHNRPATFRHPAYSFLGDWVMYRDMLTGRLTF